MAKELRALIIEDDPYSRSFMAMLLARDWRTKVAGEFNGADEVELRAFLAQPANRVDVALLDTEFPSDARLPGRLAQILLSGPHKPTIVYTCTRPDPPFLQHVFQETANRANPSGGYLVKEEILYSLASALKRATEGSFVITPGVRASIQAGLLPKNLLVIDGAAPVVHFTRRENDLVRLGLLFNLTQRDIADELVVSGDFVSEVMGNIYEKLGVHELLNGETPLEAYFHDESVLEHLRGIILKARDKEGRPLHKVPWLSTVAFHLLTTGAEEK